MKMAYDPAHNVAYIRLHEQTAQVTTLEISDAVNIDIAPDGTVYGIELLNANEQLAEGRGTLVVDAGGRHQANAMTPSPPRQPRRQATEVPVNPTLRDLPVDQRIRLVEELWDSIAADQEALPLTDEQRAELDRRLDAYEADGARGRLGDLVIAEIRKRL